MVIIMKHAHVTDYLSNLYPVVGGTVIAKNPCKTTRHKIHIVEQTHTYKPNRQKQN